MKPLRKIIGFVAFREGSKRLRRKNGMTIGGKPLYQITLDKMVGLKEVGVLNAVVASTDSAEWATRCRHRYGDKVIVHERSPEVSDDRANEGNVIGEFLSLHPDYASHAILLLLCTYPFMKTSVLKEMIDKFLDRGESVFAVVKSHHMPQKLLRIEGDVLHPYMFDSFAEYESNTKILKERYPVAFHTTGAFLISDSSDFAKTQSVWKQSKIQYVEDCSFHVDIDTEDDLILARLYFDAAGGYE